ncbi:MAG: hypothetical protein JWP87_2072 [Labilithrix sp.]|nr:hypothetical protein [Labilithrix sp.]
MTIDTVQPSVLPALTSTRPARRVLRSIGAVAAGFVAIFAVTTATDLVFHAAGVFPPLGAPPMSSALFAIAFAYRFVFDVGGSYLTARLAPREPMRHALVLGSIGLVLSVAGAIAMWDAGPAWYSLGVAASALPCAWLGGRTASRSSRPCR